MDLDTNSWICNSSSISSKKEIKMHKIYMRCDCGYYIDMEVNEGIFVCPNCGQEYMLIYNPKTSTYEFDKINARQNNNTRTT